MSSSSSQKERGSTFLALAVCVFGLGIVLVNVVYMFGGSFSGFTSADLSPSSSQGSRGSVTSKNASSKVKSSAKSIDACGGSCEPMGLCCDGVGECNECGAVSSDYDSSYNSSSYDSSYYFSSEDENIESCESMDYNPPSCLNENDPPPFSACPRGYHIEDQGCKDGTCGCRESTDGPKVRCQHTYVCKRDEAAGRPSR